MKVYTLFWVLCDGGEQPPLIDYLNQYNPLIFSSLNAAKDEATSQLGDTPIVSSGWPIAWEDLPGMSKGTVEGDDELFFLIKEATIDAPSNS